MLLVSGRNKLLSGSLQILVACEFASLMVLIAYIFHADFFAEFNTSYFRKAQWVIDSLMLVTDTTLAMTLVVLIYRKQSGFSATSSVLHHLIQYVIGTSLLTFGFTAAALICSIVWPLSLSFIALDFLGSKCASSLFSSPCMEANKTSGYVNCALVS